MLVCSDVPFTLTQYDKPDVVQTQHLEDPSLFDKIWKIFDPENKYFIPVNNVVDLLMMIPPPLGCMNQTRNFAEEKILNLQPPIHDDGNIFYVELLEGLSHNYG